MNDLMREKFEEWLCKEYPWGKDAIVLSFFLNGEKPNDQYYYDCTAEYDGKPLDDALFWLWRGYQASRAVEIELPDCVDADTHQSAGYNLAIDHCIEAITKAGFKVKE